MSYTTLEEVDQDFEIRIKPDYNNTTPERFWTYELHLKSDKPKIERFFDGTQNEWALSTYKPSTFPYAVKENIIILANKHLELSE